jgi:hypothetical protein
MAAWVKVTGVNNYSFFVNATGVAHMTRDQKNTRTMITFVTGRAGGAPLRLTVREAPEKIISALGDSIGVAR